jgi:hypothetical protein
MKYIHEKIEADKANCFRKDDQGVLWFNNRIVVPKDAEVCQQILDEAHLSQYSIHPGSTKMYQDLKQHYWRTKMKIEIARYVARCDTCRRVKAVHMKTIDHYNPYTSQLRNGRILVWISLWDCPKEPKLLTLYGS